MHGTATLDWRWLLAVITQPQRQKATRDKSESKRSDLVLGIAWATRRDTSTKKAPGDNSGRLVFDGTERSALLAVLIFGLLAGRLADQIEELALLLVDLGVGSV